MFGFFASQSATAQAKLWRLIYPREAATYDEARRAEMQAEISLRQLEAGTGRSRLDIAVNGFPGKSPLAPSKHP